MRKLLMAVLVVCLGLVACGDGGEDGGDGKGGKGGTGGTGGEEEPMLPRGEACGRPFVYRAVADSPDATPFQVHEGTTSSTSRTSGTCGGNGGEAVYRYDSPYEGTLLFMVEAQGPTHVYARTTCDDRDSELVCKARDAVGAIEVERGQEIFLVVDSANPRVPYALLVQLIPVLREGDPCPASHLDPNVYGACAFGLRCEPTEVGHRCVGNSAPTVSNVSARRMANDLVVTVTGTDPDGDAIGVAVLSFRNAAGQTIPVGNQSPAAIARFEDEVGTSFSSQRAFRRRLFLDHSNLDAATQVEVAVIDSGNMLSETRTIELVQPPVVAEGAACDPDLMLDRCAVGSDCFDPGTGAVCASRDRMRGFICEAAPEFSPGGSVTLQLATDAYALWDPPSACVNQPRDPRQPQPYVNGRPEVVARLIVEEDTPTIVLSTDDFNTSARDTVLYVYRDCGAGGEATMACNDDVEFPLNVLSELTLRDVAPGAYLVVVDSWSAGATGRVTIRADVP